MSYNSLSNQSSRANCRDSSHTENADMSLGGFHTRIALGPGGLNLPFRQIENNIRLNKESL